MEIALLLLTLWLSSATKRLVRPRRRQRTIPSPRDLSRHWLRYSRESHEWLRWSTDV